MKRITVAIIALLLSTVTFAAPANKANEKTGAKDALYERLKELAASPAGKSEAQAQGVLAEVNARLERLNQVKGKEGVRSMSVTIAEAVMVATPENGAALMKAIEGTTVDLSGVNILLREVKASKNGDESVQGANAFLNIGESTKQSVADFRMTVLSEIQQGGKGTIREIVLRNLRKNGDQKVIGKMTDDELWAEFVKRCKAMLGIA